MTAKVARKNSKVLEFFPRINMYICTYVHLIAYVQLCIYTVRLFTLISIIYTSFYCLLSLFFFFQHCCCYLLYYFPGFYHIYKFSFTLVWQQHCHVSQVAICLCYEKKITICLFYFHLLFNSSIKVCMCPHCSNNTVLFCSVVSGI